MAHPKRCFRCIESIAALGAPLAVWQRELGDYFRAVEPLLRVTDRVAERFPGARTDLPLMRVVDYRDGRFAAVCDKEMSPRLELTREQVMLRRVDEVRLRSTLCRALSLITTRDPVTTIPGLLRVGTWQSMPSDQRPVLLAVASHAAHLVELIIQAMTSTRGALVLLTPTRARWSSRSEGVVDPDRVTMVALDEVLEWHGGHWRSSPNWSDHFSNVAGGGEKAPASSFRIDTDTYAVWYGSKECPLGNTVGFRAIRRLARRPGVYVSVESLLDDAWDGALRSKSAVQKTMSAIRKSLQEHGIHEVTIDGSIRGGYILQISANGKR